ncbi:MAG: tetratricopeptide repeat protein [Candidatus Andeanibacterium colombiense]|uniref:Tetratricopeptide repeat protein n=1 Tax=Candidatus Andeanibacterium colombiense TaxID=3121345 RepID=A0AAJ5X710_9SPHN|nr:MAG: tetratricopeptide repeat protein [Sphingomonadaceae bacterium]
MPDSRRRLRGALAALTLLVLAVPLSGAGGEAEAAFKDGRAALLRGDGVAAEVALRRAVDAGAGKPAVAAWMGEAYLDQGNLDAARTWLGPGQFSPATRQHGFHMLARLELADDDLAAAGQAFAKALEGNGGTAEIWVDLGRLHYRAGEHHQALAAAETALRLDRTNIRALEFRGQLARDAQGPIASLPWFEEGLTHAPDDMSLLGEYAATLGEAGRAKDMLRVTRQMIALDGENPRAFYLQAVLAARAGNFGLARKLLYRTDDKFDQMPAAMLLEGVLEMDAGNWTLAVEALDQLARLQPDNDRITLLLARAMLENGDGSEVIARYRKLADGRGASPYLLTLIGRAFEQDGDRESAAIYLDRAARVPSSAILALPVGETGELVLFRYGGDPYRIDAAVPRLRHMLAAGRVAEAAGVAAALMRRYPGSADIETLSGDVALARGDGAEALRFYSSAAQISRPFTLMTRMAAALRLTGGEAEARKLAAGFLAQHPQDGEAAEFLARMAMQAGQWQRARVLYAYARTRNGGRNPLLYATLADAQLRLGNDAEALDDADSAFEMQRANPAVSRVFARALERAGRGKEAKALLAKAQRTPFA